MERFYRDACCLALMDGDPDLARLNAAFDFDARGWFLGVSLAEVSGAAATS